MTEFAGWQMPVQFKGIGVEHEAVRTQAGLFDISHMGKFGLRGAGAIAALQSLVPSNLERLQPGQAQYTLLLNPEGGIIDDLILYRQAPGPAGEDRWMMIVNAATTDTDQAWLVDHLQGLELEDSFRDQVLLSLQGPLATGLLQRLTPADLSQVARFGHLESTLLGSAAFLARTGYTGEDGFEIMTDAPTGIALWDALLEAGAIPCGLGARDTLRLEAAMALYGQDIDATTTPWEAGLGWVVHLEEKGEFVGRSALERQKQQGPQRRLVGLTMADRHIARHDYPVIHQGEAVGVVTSGTLSPSLKVPIALAYVPAALAQPGQSLEVAIRGQNRPALVVKRPFYRRPLA
jgi:aminomethyltransferase